MSRTLLMVLVFLWVSGSSGAAFATLDGGVGIRLVALVGEPEVFALFCEGNINEGGCQNLYLVELGASEFTRLHVQSCADNCDTSEAIEEYLARAPAELRDAVGQTSVRKVEDEEILRYGIRHDVSEPVELVPPPQLARFRPVLRVNSRVPSMGIFEASGKGDCYPYSSQKGESEFLCPGCTEADRSLDGLTFSAPVCEQPLPSASCDCTGTATTYRFLIVDNEEKRRHLGNRLFVQPMDLFQAREGGSSEDNHLEPNLEIIGLGALVLSDSILFWGSAAHAPYMNTTFFPLIASVSTRPERSPSKEPAEVEVDEPPQGDGDLPSAAARRFLFCRLLLTTWCW